MNRETAIQKLMTANSMSRVNAERLLSGQSVTTIRTRDASDNVMDCPRCECNVPAGTVVLCADHERDPKKPAGWP